MIDERQLAVRDDELHLAADELAECLAQAGGLGEDLAFLAQQAVDGPVNSATSSADLSAKCR